MPSCFGVLATALVKLAKGKKGHEMPHRKEFPDVWAQHFMVSPEHVLWKDDDVVVFRNINPQAAEHLLIVPRNRYAAGVEDLSREDCTLLRKMAEKGKKIAKPDTSQVVHLGFHQHPQRSVHFLHLHFLVEPFNPTCYQTLYKEKPGNLGTGFISYETVLKRLQNQQSPGCSSRAKKLRSV